MRTVAAAALGVALIVGACSSPAGSSSGGSTPAPAPTTAATTAPTAEPTQTGLDPNIKADLTVWHYLTTDAHNTLIADETALFNQSFPNVTVKNEFVPFDQLTPKLLASAASKQGPDVAVFQWGDVQSLAAAGVLQDMNSYWGSFADASTFAPSVVHSVNGKVYTAQAYANLIGLWYNSDILAKDGITPPTTTAEFEAALAKVTAAGDGGLAIDGKPGVDGWWTGMPFFFGEGLDVHMADQAKVTSVYAQVKSWVDKGYIPKEAVTWDQDTVFNKFLTGKFAFAVGGNWYAQTATKATFKYGVVPLPAGSAGSKVYLGGEGEAIGAYTANPDLAWAYLQATWFSKAGQLLALKDVGNLPTRSDAASDPAISSSPVLSGFATAVQTGVALPITPAENQAQTLMGDLWSAVLSGQKTPEQAAAELAQKLPTILK